MRLPTRLDDAHSFTWPIRTRHAVTCGGQMPAEPLSPPPARCKAVLPRQTPLPYTHKPLHATDPPLQHCTAALCRLLGSRSLCQSLRSGRTPAPLRTSAAPPCQPQAGSCQPLNSSPAATQACLAGFDSLSGGRPRRPQPGATPPPRVGGPRTGRSCPTAYRVTAGCCTRDTSGTIGQNVVRGTGADERLCLAGNVRRRAGLPASRQLPWQRSPHPRVAVGAGRPTCREEGATQCLHEQEHNAWCPCLCQPAKASPFRGPFRGLRTRC
jgi:hypothetical protein